MWQYAAAAAVGAVSGLAVLDRLVPWLRTDVVQLYIQLTVLFKYKILVWKRHFIVEAFEQQAAQRPKKTFLIFQDNEYTYEYMNTQANRMAHVAVDQLGLKKGDIVALLCHNEPAFFWTFYGLSKVGVQVAFLNFNLRTQSLLHCFKVCGASRLFVGQGDDLIQAVEEISSDLDPDMLMYTQGQSQVPSGFKRLDDLLAAAPKVNPDRRYRGTPSGRDTLCYIFTSGTTGLPKAAVVSHLKQVKAACLMRFYSVSSADVIYCPLPLYHSAAAMIAAGNAVYSGATLVLRNKFSASQFWDDCCRHDVTIVHYIGELCRYLVNMPTHPKERSHCVRLAFGNGLRRDVWTEFTARFNIPYVGEFYAATEGNCGFINVLNAPGSVGRLSPLSAKLYPVHFIHYDFETAEPLRAVSGRCTEVEIGEPGLMIAPVKRDFEYDGYKNNEALTRKKVIRDVFREGDVFYNSGDLFTRDATFNIYFCDRLGDTFRWKGENVSTIEVSNAVSGALSQVEDANVYGVSVPGCDGRAGMAAITLVPNGPRNDLTPAACREMFSACVARLPPYAVPRFVRVVRHMQVSSTHKQLKTHLVKEGFDPALVRGDPLYYVDLTEKTFKPLDQRAYQDILNHKVRL